MKVTYRIPTKEQFAFVEIEMDVNQKGNPPELLFKQYREFIAEAQGKITAGLSEKDFVKVFCEYAQTGAIVDGGNYEFSDAQKVLMGEMRKLIRKNPPAELVQEVNSMAKTLD